MKRRAVLVAAAAGFVAGAITMLELLDRLFGGSGAVLKLLDDEPGGGWGL